MDPDEMDAWEAYQQQERECGGDGLEFLGSGDSIVDPADIPLCSEYASQGQCRKGDACPLIHGDECEVSQLTHRRGCVVWAGLLLSSWRLLSSV